MDQKLPNTNTPKLIIYVIQSKLNQPNLNNALSYCKGSGGHGQLNINSAFSVDFIITNNT